MTIAKIGILLLIILCYLFLIYIQPNPEGMCTLDDLEQGELTVYHGKFGSVTVKTLNNGDNIIVAVNRNSNVEDSEHFVLYGPSDESITIYKTEEGRYVVANESEETEHTGEGTMTYYGNNGSITVKTDEEGNKSVVNYNFEKKNTDAVQIYWGPNGNSVEVMVSTDGTVKILSSNNVHHDDVYRWNRKKNRRQYHTHPNSCSNYVRKTEIVPPVCPTCPSITSCEKISNEDSDDEDEEVEANTKEEKITGPKGGTVTKTSEGDVIVKGSQGGTAVVTSEGNAIVRGPEGNVVTQNSNGTTVYSQNDTQGNTTVNATVTNMSSLTRGKVGMYLGDNGLIDSPIPVLNNFSSFGR